MAKKESIQKRLQKVRPPRVQLTYDVEIGDAIEKKELPFVVGVLGDFTGQPDPEKPLPKLKDRKFVQVDLDNIDDVMKGMAPKASYRVRNRLSPEGGEFAVNLAFDKVEDFRPESVVQQVEPLRKLLEARQQLSNLVTYMDGKTGAEQLVERIMNDPELLKSLAAQAKPAEE